MEMALGILAAAAGGLAMGSSVWPMKLMRKFQFEHWWFLAMLTGLIIVPWTISRSCLGHDSRPDAQNRGQCGQGQGRRVGIGRPATGIVCAEIYDHAENNSNDVESDGVRK